MAQCQNKTRPFQCLPLKAGEFGDRRSGECLSATGDLPCQAIRLLGDDGLLLGFSMKGITAFIGPCLVEGVGETRRILCADGGPCPDILLQ